MFFIIQNANRFYSFIWEAILAVPRRMFNANVHGWTIRRGSNNIASRAHET
jgi:hypothetical protein